MCIVSIFQILLNIYKKHLKYLLFDFLYDILFISGDNMNNTWVEIDLAIIEENLNILKKEIGKINIIAIVKGNAYGHGLIEVSKKLEDQVAYLGVGVEDEGIKLRLAGVKAPILILSPFFDEKNIIKYNLTPTIDNIPDLKKLNAIGEKNNMFINFHLKLNTGLNRFGISIDDIDEFINEYKKNSNVNIEGTFSHLAKTSKKNTAELNKQIEIFNNALNLLKEQKINPKYIHIANSKVAIDFPFARFNTVRIGNCLYGEMSSEKLLPIKEAYVVKTKVIYIRNIKKGQHVGYSRKKTNNDMKIALIPVGFIDGYYYYKNKKNITLKDALFNITRIFYRYIKPRSMAYYNKKALKIIGLPNMQYSMIDITDIEEIEIGSEISLVYSMYALKDSVQRLYLNTK